MAKSKRKSLPPAPEEEPEDLLNASSSSIVPIVPMSSSKSQQVMGPAPTPDVTTVPKLLSNGANWVTFKRRMVVDIEARAGLIRHLEGRAPYPKPPAPLKAKPSQQEQDEYTEKLEKHEDAMDLWRLRDATVKRQIMHNIPDTVLIRIQSLTTAAEMWEALRKEFEGRTAFVQDDLRYKIQTTRCGEHDNVRQHTDKMRYMLEELAGMGATITDADYSAAIMRSLPASYANYLAPIVAAGQSIGVPLTPSQVMDYAVSEYDRRITHNPPKQRAGVAPPTGDAALYTYAPEPGRSGRRGKHKGKDDEKRTCYNCGETGHLKRNCKKPKKDGDKPKGSGNGNASQGASTGTSKPPVASASIAEVKEPTPPPTNVYSAVAFTGYTGDVQGAIFDSGCTAHVSPY